MVPKKQCWFEAYRHDSDESQWQIDTATLGNIATIIILWLLFIHIIL